MINFRTSTKWDKEGIIIFIAQEQIHQKKLFIAHGALQEEIQSLIKNNQFSADHGEIIPLMIKDSTVLLVGLGKKSELSLTALRTTVRKAILSSFFNKIKEVAIIPHEDKEENIQAIIEGMLIGTYTWKKYLSKDKNDKTVDAKDVAIIVAYKKVYDETITICEGVNLTRDLVNDNADLVTSEYLEATVRSITKAKKEITLKVLNKKELKAEGLGLHLAVNQGSSKEPKLIIVKYSGGSKNEKYTALIGKGITFDTGGLNLKPTGSMETMRTDMSGAAAVIGVLKNVLALKLKKNIIFVCTIAENCIGSGAYKPGDVFRAYNGKTVEIGNTDAEGRLVLADAIAYVVKNYKPGRIVDIATLTGACVVALGHDYTGVITPFDEMSKALIRSAKETDDRAWRLPIYSEMKDHIKSQIADIKNISNIRGAAGASTGAEFLRQFTNDIQWAHLDIAGTAYVDGTGRLYFGHGATGAGVRLLTHFLQHN